MIGISSALDSLRNALQAGTLQAAKIAVVDQHAGVNVVSDSDDSTSQIKAQQAKVAEMQAKADENYERQVLEMPEMTARYRESPDWAKFDESNNTVTLPDVQSLSKEGAAHVQRGVQYLLDLGRLEGKTVVASNGNQSTESLATYRDWLQAHAGFDAYA